MYIPRLNAEQDTSTLHAFIEGHPFATLVTSRGGLFATHLPLVLRPSDGPCGTLEGKWKLSQNRSEADVTGVVDGLRGSAHAGDVEVANAMEALRQKAQQ